MSAANTERAIEALTRAARTEHDFAGWLAHVLAQVAGQLGASDALIAGRPGSWEASFVDQLVKGTVGHRDEYLPKPRGKLTDAQVREIRDLGSGLGAVSQRELAAVRRVAVHHQRHHQRQDVAVAHVTARRRQPCLGGYLPVFVAMAALIVLARLLLLLLPVLLAGAVVAGCWRWTVRRQARVALRRPPTLRGQPVVQGHVVAEDKELARLRDENDQLRADLADAQASARAAWDAAASVPPRQEAAHPPARDRLLADQLGGLHDLWERP